METKNTFEELKNFEDTEKKSPKDQDSFKKSKNDYKEEDCSVIAYNEKEGILDVNFKGCGIRINNVKNFTGKRAIIKYKGEIGKPDFSYKL